MTQTADTSTEGPGGDQASRPNSLATAVLLAGAALAYGVIAFQALYNGHALAEEVTYLIKSWWYTNGLVAPYTATDATAKMPFYFYQLGFWQQLAGMGFVPARLTSITIGVINGALLFAICRRLTANTLVAAAAVFIFLATPSTTFSFATATPAATVSALHLAAVWLIISSLGRPRPWATAAMALLCTALYFYGQHTILGIVVLAPLYIAAIGRKRWLHVGLLLAITAGLTAVVFFSFPDKLGQYALRLPVISPMLDSIHLLAPNFTLIDKGTLGTMTMGPAFDRAAPADILDTFLLPYSGTLVLALMLFGLAGAGLRVLWIAPLYFLWLAGSHYFASLGYCESCMLSYAPYFSGLGALAAALTLAMVAHRARQNHLPAGPFVLIGATLAVALNAFAPNFAVRGNARGYPIPLMVQTQTTSEMQDIETFARWISSNATIREPILALHGLGGTKLATLPYAVFLSGHMLPPQSIDPAASRRVVNPKLSATAREAVQAAIEEESLWTDATLARWIERDYDLILFQVDKALDQRAQLATLTSRFDLAAATVYRGSAISLYKRKAVQ